MKHPWPRNVSCCYDKRANKIGHRGGGQANFNLAKRLQNGGIAVLCAQDQGQLIATLQHRLTDTEKRLAAHHAAFRETERDVQQLQNGIGEMTRERAQTHGMCSQLQNDMRHLREEIEDMTNSTSSALLADLQDEKQKLTSSLETTKLQFPDILASMRKCKEEKEMLMKEREQLVQQLDGLASMYDDVRVNAEEMAQKREKILKQRMEVGRKAANYEHQAGQYRMAVRFITM